MLQRPARRTIQTWPHQKTDSSTISSQPLGRSRLRAIILSTLFLAALGGTSYFLFAPSSIECLTNIFTTCTADEERVLQSHYTNRWQTLTKNPKETLPQLQTELPELESLKTYLSWRGESKAQITRSHLVATVQIGSEHWEVLSGGQQKPSAPSLPNILFADQTSWKAWIESYQTPSTALTTLEAFSKGVQALRPRATTIKIINKDEVEIRLENSSRALLHLHSPAEVQTQLHTLQAVFSSSTMDTQPTEVDVRFKNVITR